MVGIVTERNHGPQGLQKWMSDVHVFVLSLCDLFLSNLDCHMFVTIEENRPS